MRPFPSRAQGMISGSLLKQVSSLSSFSKLFPSAILFLLTIFLTRGLAAPASAQQVRQTLHTHVRAEISSHQAALVNHLSVDQRLHVSIVLPLRNQAALSSLLGRLYDPSSPDYRKFLSVAEFTEQFGPTQADYDAVVAFATANGLTVTDIPANRLVVPVSGTTDQINQAFNVQMNVYQHPTENRTFFSPDREPSLALNVPVSYISGLDDFSLPHPMRDVRPANAQPFSVTGSGPSGSYLGSDMRAAYYGGSTLTGSGQAVGIFEFGGYLLSDVNATFTNAGQTNNVPVNNVLLDGATGTPSPQLDNGAEQALDIVQAIGMAPGLSQVRVYIGTGTDDANILNSMASENIAKSLSCSWGWRPADPAAADVFFQEMAAQGQSFFTASGDNGAFYAAINPFFYPSEDAYVTAVGGTHLTTNGAGGAWASETAWNSGSYGSGGGISPDNIPIPSWQTGLANSANGGSTTLRNVPDVAMEGDFDNYACAQGVCRPDYAGTSFAAPRWAGFMALVNQQAIEAGNAPNGGVGFINPQLYLLAEGARFSNDLHDIVSGNNKTGNQPVWFSAVPGYDLVTGWGSPTGQSLIDDLAGPQVPGFFIGSSQGQVTVNPGGTASVSMKVTDAGGFTGSVTFAVTSTLPTGVTASFSPNPTADMSTLTLTATSTAVQASVPVTVTATSGNLSATTSLTLAVHAPSFALSVSPSTVGINQGASGTTTVVVVPQYGFAAAVNLVASGLPAGVTASFSPASTTGTSTLTLTASSSATPGTSTVTVTGGSDSLTATATFSLSIHGPSFSLSSYNVSMGQGTTGTSTIYVSDLYGFTGSVNLVASGLPSGVTASFSPNPVTGSSTLTLIASSSAPIGQSTVTVTGTSGALSATTTFTLSIFTPTFTISGSSSVSVGQGSSGSAYVYVSPQYGFTGSVTFSVTGLPAGVTALWSPNPSTSSSNLTLVASSSAKAGQYALTIAGVSGLQSATTNLMLTVAVPTFTLSSYSTVNLGQGTTSSAYIYVTPQYGFTGSVNLSISGLPSGVTGTFSPNPTTGSSMLTLQASNTAALGQYSATITGTSGMQTVTIPFSLAVYTPTFTLSNIGTLNVGRGTTTSGYVYVNPLYGFTGSVNLSVSGLPSGVTASFAPNPTTNNTTLTLTASSTASLGQYTATITGTYGSQTVTAPLTVGVYTPTFTLYGSSSATIGQGTSSTTYVSISPQYGFAGGVNLSVSGLPTGVTASFSPNPVTSNSSSTLTLTASSTAALGQYTLTITGTSGSQTATMPLTLGVYTPSFTLNSYGGNVSIGQGSSSTSYVYLSSQYGFSGSVNLSVAGLPSGVTASIATNPTTSYSTPITFAASSSASVGASTITVTGVSGTQTSSTTFLLNVYPPTFTLSSSLYNVSLNEGATGSGTVFLYGQYGFSGNVMLAASGLPNGVTATFSPNPANGNGNAAISLVANSTATPGTSTVTITGTSGASTASTTFMLTVNTPGYTLTAAPSRLVLAPGSSVKSTVTVAPLNGFAGNVNLTTSGLPTGVTASFSSVSTSTTSVLTLTADGTVAPGTSTVTISGSSGNLTNSTMLTLIVPGAQVATSTTLALTSSGTSVSSVTGGTMIAATATVKAGSTPVTTGQVDFCDATAQFCDAYHLLGSAQLTRAGTATLRFVPGIGSRSYKAVFIGTSSITSSASATANLAVTGSQQTTTSLAVTGSAGSYALTGTVTAAGPVVPSGSVSFLDTNNGNAQLSKTALVGGQATFSFINSQTVTVGSAPTSPVTGDFNNDGVPDLAVLNYNTNSISILLGKGDGTFTSAAGLTTAAQPTFAVVGDFNRDGNADLAILSSYGNSLVVFLGNGDGTFAPAALSPQTGSYPNSLAMGDFNGDGLQDLAIGNQNISSLTILLGNGDGTFTPSTTQPTGGTSLRSLTPGDFNGDGIQDLAAVTNTTGTLTILLGNGDGTFNSVAAPAGLQSFATIAVGDLNGDGKPDLVLANSGAPATVLLGNGDGSFRTGTNVAVGLYTSGLTVADMNQDGKPDLIAVNSYGSGVSTFLGNGDGTFGSGISSSTGSYPSAVAIGDWNGDGIPDVAVANNGNNFVTVLTSALAQKATASVAGISVLGHGQHAVEASYGGDTAYLSSVSAPANVTATPGAPAVALSLAAPSITTAQSLAVTVSVSGGAGNPVPTGTVTLTSGSYTSAAATLSSGSAVITVPAGSLPAGNDALSVSYAPDAAGSTAYTAATGTGSVTVTLAIGTTASTVAVTPSVATITNLQNTTVSVSVTGVSGQPTPTGTITLSSGSYTAQQTLSSGAASFTVAGSGLSAGANTLTATYSGDGVYASKNGTATVTVAPVLMSASSTQPVSAGASVNSTLSLLAGGNYSGTLKLSCTLTASPAGAQSLPACSLNPASMALTAGGTGSATLTVTTTAATKALLDAPSGPPSRGYAYGGTFLAAILFFLLPAKRRRFAVLALLLGFVAAGISGCASGSGGSTTPPPSGGGTPGTTAGSYTFAVTATDSGASISATTNVAVTVQ